MPAITRHVALLFDHELRDAARLMHRAYECQMKLQKADTPEHRQEYCEAVCAAAVVASAALWDIRDDVDAITVIKVAPIMPKVEYEIGSDGKPKQEQAHE